MPKKACNLFRDVDKLFNDKFVHEGRFNDDYSLYNEFCPQGKDGVKKCNTDYERISAIGGYLFMQLTRTNKMNLNNDNDHYSQYFIMWISHKLYKIAANNIASLDQSYEENLGKSIGNFNFWNLLQNQRKELKDANITIMNMFYLLLKQICETIEKYQTPSILGHEYTKEAIQCNIIYDEISKSINHCGSYLKILDHFKTMFDGFIHTANKENIHGNDVLSQLIKFSSIDKNTFKHDFSSSSCNQVHQNLIKNPPNHIKKEIKRLKSVIKKNLQKPSNSESSSSIASPTQEDTPLKNPSSELDFLAIPSEDEDDNEDDGEDGNAEDDDALETLDDTKGNLPIDTDHQNQNLDPKQGNSTDAPENGTQMKTPQMNDPSASPKSPSQGQAPGDTRKTETRDKDSIPPIQIEGPPIPLPVPMKQTQDDNSQQSHQITDSNIPGGASPPSDSGPKDTDKIKEPQENKQGAVGGEQKDSGGGIGNGTNPHSDPSNPNSHPLTSDTNQGNPNDGSADGKGDTDNGLLNTGDGQDDRGPGDGSDGDQGSQGGLGGSGGSGDGPGNAPVEKGPHSMSGDPIDTGPSFFNIAFKGMDKLSNTLKFFEKHKKKITEATETINNLYNTSMSNIKNAYDNSRNFLNSIIDNISNQPEKVDMPSTLGGSQSGSNGTGGGLHTTNDPSPPQKDSPQTPSGTSHTSLPSPDPKDQPNVPQLSQDLPGSQSYDQSNQGGSKIPVVKPENSVTKVKGNETTRIGDIYVLKEYKQIGISIIVILIPITLAIMYKYLSSGWRKELKRKKNMKKVINSIGGKRSVKIIISSSSQKKQTKKFINSVYRRKPPLLNIYKLMQANPVPFINLFFLLIFFVYKRKDNSIE
ncbi:PIR protein CIR protein [Plasmodium vinckei lentum]|uniref:PIR protein CIR protein n=1 Tax=Plasmodium vinckei lentum TaxID=138297 RepID=A0A6V7RSW5_PLAVN|nr:PIR protein CIR protein [Plasmodium vinckei lentum]